LRGVAGFYLKQNTKICQIKEIIFLGWVNIFFHDIFLNLAEKAPQNSANPAVFF